MVGQYAVFYSEKSNFSVESVMKKTAILVVVTGLSLINSTVALAACPSADLSGDCLVDLEDFAILSSQWLNIYDYNDLTEMADQWLTGDPIQAVADRVSQMDYQMYQLDVESMGLGLYGGPGYDMGYRNRDGWAGAGSLGNQEARLYIQDEFTAMGLSVSLQGRYLNVVGELTGTTTPDKIYIIGAHYDHLDGDMPGGDDNASGTAGVLEAARVLSRYQFESTIRFICFNAEEDGSKGSRDYVAELPPDENIVGMINMDMILRPGSDVDPYTVIDAELETNGSLPWLLAYEQAAADYVPSLIIGNIWNYTDSWSDNDSFQDEGIPSFLVIENSWDDWDIANPYYHTYEDASDRLANDSPNGVTYDYTFATDVVRASTALIAQEAVVVTPYLPVPDTIPPIPNPATFASAPSADTYTAISMTATIGTDASHSVEYFFDEITGNPGATDSGWQSSPSYTDSGLTAYTEYTYTVTMRDASGNTGAASIPASATTDDSVLLENIVLPANGGNLDSYTSQYSASYPASALTNEITNETGWSSALNPEPQQEFVYSFSDGNSATLNDAVIHGGNAEGSYYSKDVEVWTSADGSNYTLAGGGTLANINGSTVTVALTGIVAEKIKLVITEGYRTDYWELAEFVVNGIIIE